MRRYLTPGAVPVRINKRSTNQPVQQARRPKRRHHLCLRRLPEIGHGSFAAELSPLCREKERSYLSKWRLVLAREVHTFRNEFSSMNWTNPYSFTFFLVVAATVVVGVLEAWGAFVHNNGFDPLLTLVMSLMLIPLYIMKQRSHQSNASSSC